MSNMIRLGEYLKELNSLSSSCSLSISVQENFYVAGMSFWTWDGGKWVNFNPNHFDCPYNAVADTICRLRDETFIRVGYEKTSPVKHWNGKKWEKVPR